jgi:hypothetical protein
VSAARYIARGLAVVPVVHSEKRCVTRDWQNLRIGADDVQRHFGGGPQNLGIFLGEPSDGVVDVDLDVPEAATLAEHFLPPTITSGRASSPQSHWFFRAPGIASEKWKDTAGKAKEGLEGPVGPLRIRRPVDPRVLSFRYPCPKRTRFRGNTTPPVSIHHSATPPPLNRHLSEAHKRCIPVSARPEPDFLAGCVGRRISLLLFEPTF